MTAPLMTGGDPLSTLSQLAPDAEPADDDALRKPDGTERPRGLLWGLDLSECSSRREAKAALQHAVDGLKRTLDENPTVKRVCLACVRPRQFPQKALVKVPAGLSLRIHNDLERDRGKFVRTLVLDVTECDDPARLRERVEEALASDSCGWVDLTASWDDIAEQSLCEAWEAESL